jgi:hypothetical protein
MNQIKAGKPIVVLSFQAVPGMKIESKNDVTVVVVKSSSLVVISKRLSVCKSMIKFSTEFSGKLLNLLGILT